MNIKISPKIQLFKEGNAFYKGLKEGTGEWNILEAIMADATELGQMLINLALNSRKT